MPFVWSGTGKAHQARWSLHRRRVEFVSLAAAKGCDAYLTADIKYHEAQKAVEMGIAVADVTHYASEVLIVPVLQEKLQAAAKENGWNIEVVCSAVDGQTFWTIE